MERPWRPEGIAFLELKLQVVVSSYVVAENQTWVSDWISSSPIQLNLLASEPQEFFCVYLFI